MDLNLPAKFLQDRDHLAPGEYEALRQALQDDPELARELKDQLVMDDLLGRTLSPDRLDFPAQVLQRIRDLGNQSARVARVARVARAVKDRRARWRRWSYAAAACLAIVTGILAWRGTASNGIAVMADAGPQVAILRAGKSLPAVPDRSLLADDQVTVPAGQTAEFAYPDGTRVELGSGSTIVLQPRSMPDASPGKGKTLLLAQGALRGTIAVQPADRPLVLASPQATAVVLGTTLEFRATRDSTRLEVSDGLVRFQRIDRPAAFDVGSGGYALAGPGLTLTANARVAGTDEPRRLIEDHEGPLAWQQSVYSAPLAFGNSTLAHGGKTGLRVAYEPKPGDTVPYGAIDHPLVLKPGDRALRFFVNVERHDGNANWNIQVRQRDMTCWHMGGGRFEDLGKGWNLIELELPASPANAYGGGSYSPGEVKTLILSVCQRPTTFTVDDFVLVGGRP